MKPGVGRPLVRTIVVREITPRELAVIPATVPGKGGHFPLWVPVVRECKYELDPVLSGGCNHLVEPLQAIRTLVNGRMAAVENLSYRLDSDRAEPMTENTWKYGPEPGLPVTSLKAQVRTTL